MIVLKHTVNSDNVVLGTDKGLVKIVPYSDNTIKIIYTKEDEFNAKKSLSVINDNGFSPQFQTKDNENYIDIATKNLRLRISKVTCAFSYYDADGRLLTKEPDRGGKHLDAFELYRPVFTSDTKVKSIDTPDGTKNIISDTAKEFNRIAYHTKLEFEWAEDEAIYGLGQYEEGHLNLRGHSIYMYQHNFRVVLPLLLSTRGYGVFLDSYTDMTFRDDEYGSYIWTDADDSLEYYFIAGDCFDNIIREYRKMTGSVPMLPRWAFGYIQSKERYKTKDEILAVAQEYRERNSS